MLKRREQIARIIYEEEDAAYICRGTKWKSLSSVYKKKYFDIADRILSEVFGKQYVEEEVKTK